MTIGFALCGSFCTYSRIFPIMERLARDYDLVPIFSQSAYGTDSRFGTPLTTYPKRKPSVEVPFCIPLQRWSLSVPKNCWTRWSLPPAPEIPWLNWPAPLPMGL